MAKSQRKEECPVPLAHDRFGEAHWHLHQMMDNYHNPMTFRYSTNAFLSSLKSSVTMLQLDLERLGQNEWRKARTESLRDNALFVSFSKGRDVVAHRGSLVRNSNIQAGLFRGRKLKLVLEINLDNDLPSREILQRLQRQNKILHFVDEKHSAISEQLGVWRSYREPALSADEDVLTASDRVWRIVGQLMNEAHQRLGYRIDEFDAPLTEHHDTSIVDTLLETDMDPSLVEKWRW